MKTLTLLATLLLLAAPAYATNPYPGGGFGDQGGDEGGICDNYGGVSRVFFVEVGIDIVDGVIYVVQETRVLCGDGTVLVPGELIYVSLGWWQEPDPEPYYDPGPPPEPYYDPGPPADECPYYGCGRAELEYA